MALGDILLGLQGSEILLTPFGRSLKIVDTYPIIREGRTASGRLVRDFGGTKKKQFIIDYSEIDGDNLNDILELEEYMTQLSLQIAVNESLYQGYWILMKPVERKRILLLSPGLWGGVTMTLDEV